MVSEVENWSNSESFNRSLQSFVEGIEIYNNIY